jgi:AraC-like DNA-binding protein
MGSYERGVGFAKPEKLTLRHGERSIAAALSARFGVEFVNALEIAPDALISSSPHDYRALLPREIGSGWIRSIVPAPGVEVALMDFSLRRPLSVDFSYGPTPIELGFWQMGRGIRYRYDFTSGVTRPNEAHLSRIPRPFSGDSYYPGGERIRGAGLSIEPELFWDWVATEEIPPSLEPLLTETDRIVIDRRAIPASLALPLLQLFDAGWSGAMSRLYCEAKVMEIVDLYLRHLSPQQSCRGSNGSQAETEGLHRAKQIVMSQFRDPPSLSQLARTVGVNEQRLKSDFKALFGTTVFGMVYELRMARARELVESSRYSVTEVAMQVGYSTPSAFSAAFKRKYGITPRQARR